MSAKQVHGKCRLCLEEDWLVDSHIIPKSHYKPLKEEGGYFYAQSTDPQKRTYKEQKGITEPLLCKKCDNERLSRYENDLAKVFLVGRPPVGQPFHGFTGKNYNYKQVKNGLLSILWRMSVSSQPYFKDVDLGPKHEETLRLALYNDSEFSEERYPIILTVPIFEGGYLGNWMLPPDYTKLDGNWVYRCLISGLLFTFFVGSASLGRDFSQVIMRRNHWPIITARVEQVPFLWDACIQLGRANVIRGD